MIIPAIEIEWTANSNIRTEAVSLARPLLEAAAIQAVKTRDRIQKKGRSGGGRGGARFRPYAKRTKRIRRKLGLQTQFRDFTRSGAFLGSMKSKLQSPTKAAVVFTGRAAKGTRKTKKGKVVRLTNAALARVLLRRESVSLFEPTSEEVDAFLLFLSDRLTTEILTAQSLEETAHQIARRSRSAQRRADKALRATRGRR